MRVLTLRENIAKILAEAEDRRKLNNYMEADRLEKLAARARITGYLVNPYPTLSVGWHSRFGFDHPNQRGMTLQAASPFTHEMTDDERAQYDRLLNEKKLRGGT